MHWLNLERKPRATRPAVLITLCAATPALAHVFGSTYTPPVPVVYYQAGAAAALLLSFVVAAWLLRSPTLSRSGGSVSISLDRAPKPTRFLVLCLQLAGVALLLLAVCSGFLGTPNPYLNFSMTGFWVVFVLGFLYAHVVFGNLLEPLNPWRTVCTWSGRLAPGMFRGRLRDPARYGYLPALVLYIAFIWFELYGAGAPVHTARLLLGYTIVCLAGALIWGVPGWLRYGELFSVLFRLVSHLAPLARCGGTLILRWPLAGLLRARTDGLSHLLFILFMLASTAFDGLQSMISWLEMTWSFLRAALADAVAANPAGAVSLLQTAFKVYHGVGLVLAPFWYFLVYQLALALARAIAGSRHSFRDWLLAFGMSLVPIAVVYHAAHYYTLLQVQGLKVFPLLSDPFGQGRDLLGTLHWFHRPIYPDPPTVWNAQVALILLGHLLGVLVAHIAALRLLRGTCSRPRLIASQLPLLLLMVVLTVFGLWILAQPAATGR